MNKTLLLLLTLCGLSHLWADNITPHQLLFKTSQPLQIQRGRTGLPAFDSYLNSLGAIAVTPLKGLKDSRWFSASITGEPDWQNMRANSLHFDGIDVVQPNYINTMYAVPNDPYYSLQQMQQVSLPQAWNYTTGSPLVIVGVVDSGILKDHPDLQGNIFANNAEIPDNGIDDDNNGYIDDVCGWDFADAPELSDNALGDYIGQDNDVTDENFHGTHVSGIIGAATNNGIGVSGVCWNVKILPVRAGFRTPSGSGFLQDDDAAAALIYAADMGASVVNMSWGDPNYSPIIADACAYAYGKGVILVASAGNDPGPYLSYPAKLSCVISVGAVNPYKALAGFSSYGPELDLVAPGENVYSTYKSTGTELYKEMSGTSMSAPFVTGAAALLKSLQPNISPDEARSCILSSCDDLGDQGYDIKFGHGLLNVKRMLENTSPPYVKVAYPPDHIGMPATFGITGTIDANNFFRYSVMYTTSTTPTILDWYDVTYHVNQPTFHYSPVENDTLALFRMVDLMPEGEYLIRIQYESQTGAKYNYYTTIFVDSTPPVMRENSLSVFKRYDGQNVKYYAGALFNEAVHSELYIYTNSPNPIPCYSVKTDSVQVWQLPGNLPTGPISMQINATNNSDLTYHSPLFSNVVNIQYELITNYGFTSRDIGDPMVPVNRFYDMDADGNAEMLKMDLPTSGYGTVQFVQPTDGEYLPKYTYPSAFWPLDVGDTYNGKQELLYLDHDTAYLNDCAPTQTFPADSVWVQTGISGGTIADYNADNQKDILLVKNTTTERIIQLYRRTAYRQITQKNTLHNTTATNSKNMFVPTVIVDNLDNDNRPDILSADTDGDIMIFEILPGENQQAMTWHRRIPVGDAYYLTTGDFNGDGTQDFFVGGYNKDVTDPNQTYWFFEGFTRSGDNNYTSMGFIQFVNVISQNAIQALDVDNDGKEEIILALSPYLYILKYQNGEFKPIFCGNSMRNYRLAAWTQNGAPHFIANQLSDQDSLRAVEWTAQAPFTGPATPANLLLTPMDEHNVFISWQSNGADSYQLFRKSEDEPSQQICSVATNSYVDSGLTPGKVYYYALAATDDSYTPQQSLWTQWQSVTPLPQPQVQSITMIDGNQLRIVFDQPMSSLSLIAGCYSVDHDMGSPLSVNSVLNQHGVQMRFRSLFPATTDPFHITLRNVYGITGVTPVTDDYTFSFNYDYTSPYIMNTIVMKDNRTVELTMSEDISADSATDPAHYTLLLPENDHDNSITSVTAADNVIRLRMAHKLRYSNKPYYLTLHNISDLSGNPISSNHNTTRFVLSEINDLDHVVVYPNPVYASQNTGVSFLNFPSGKKGNINIYNSAGDLVYDTGIGPFNLNNNNITYTWNCRNQSGSKVSSGIYFYVINMGGKTAKGRFAVLN